MIIRLRGLDRSRAEAIVASAIEMLVVMASSSVAQPDIAGKMSSNQTLSGAPFVAQASM